MPKKIKSLCQNQGKYVKMKARLTEENGNQTTAKHTQHKGHERANEKIPKGSQTNWIKIQIQNKTNGCQLMPNKIKFKCHNQGKYVKT